MSAETPLDELFARALELDGAARSALLAELERARPADALELASLLAVHERAGSFLEQPALLDGAPLRAEAGELPLRVGSYRVLGLLGEGGMGIVYLAEQEHPRRTVALKVLRPALASPRELARFRREAELLGRLEHRGIARIYEAGVADSDAGPRPFFAMERVRGRPVDRYCAEEGLSTRARLALVADVCDAVEHAHAHGIVHRDLKPSNVLVDDTGGQPEVKVLDFGVARASGSETLTTAARTAVGQLIGTLPYMSPEQAAGDPEAVDARADVYALGVIAYELVSGRRPYDVEGCTLLEAVRVIREVEPTPLSDVQRVLRGDVETIVGKALEKDPARRYAGASALAADLRRWLADRPILARPPSAAYQLSKLARRHKALFAGIGGSFLALAAGLVVALHQGELMRRERDLAEAARRDADAVSLWLEGLLAQADPRFGDREVTLREALEAGARDLPAEVLAAPAIEARVRTTLGVIFGSLGELERSEAEYELACERARAAFGEEYETTLKVRAQRASLWYRRGRHAEAEAELASLLPALVSRVGESHPSALEAADFLASCRTQLGRYAEAEEWLRRAPGLYRARGEELRALEAENNLGYFLVRSGRIAEAARVLRGALERNRELQGPRHPNSLMMANNLALALERLGQVEESVRERRDLAEASREVLGDDHPDTWTARLNLGTSLVELGQIDEALPLLEDVLAARERIFGPESLGTLTARNNLARALNGAGRHAEAEEHYLRVIAGLERLPDGGGANTANTLQNLGHVHLALGEPFLALDDMRAALAAMEDAHGPEHWHTAKMRVGLALALRACGEREEAERELAGALGVLEAELGAQHPRTLGAAYELETLRAELAAAR